MAALPAPNGDICEWEAEGVLILMTAGRAVLRAGIGLAGGQGPAVPVAGDTFRGGACSSTVRRNWHAAPACWYLQAQGLSPGLPAGGVSWSVRGSQCLQESGFQVVVAQRDGIALHAA